MDNEKRIENAFLYIEAAYARLQKTGKINIREQQVTLSKDIAKAFIEGTTLVAEAPTGTGKTLAYMVGAMAARRTHAEGEPLVVSTATKALQQQLLSSDLPVLTEAGVLAEHEVGIAKGKSNYVCLRNSEDILSRLRQGEADPEFFVDDATAQVDPESVHAMLKALEKGQWNGDFDLYENPSRPENLRPFAVNGETCSRKKCEHFSKCAYYKARAALSTVQVIVANHDLTLLDLLLASQEIEPTLPLANYRVVFDEAHHLPEKALKLGTTEAPLSVLHTALIKLGGVRKLISDSPELTRVLAGKGVREEQFDRAAVVPGLKNLISLLSLVDVDRDTCQKRFVGGALPGPLADAVRELKVPLSSLAANLKQLVSTVVELQPSMPEPVAEKAGELMRRALDVFAPADASVNCMGALLDAKRSAKWVFRKEDALSLHCAPLEGSDVLTPLLWKNPRALSSVMVSATLRDVGGFSRFASKAGLPGNTQFKVLPYTFPYAQSRLTVAAMKNTPKPAERREFYPELARKLPQAINPAEGTLVIFPSWAMLREFAPRLRERFGVRVRVQGDVPVRLLVRDHKRAMDSGEGSILVGVATLSEGLDLPGHYCTHVVVVALPFAVPTDPVEQELAEILGQRYFSERSLPDAMVRLTQIVGRLLRRESDRGRVTVFDRRLASTSYGRQMLKSLPPFKKEVAPLES